MIFKSLRHGKFNFISNFISFKDIEEEHVMHSKSDSIEIMTYDDADEVLEELFESLLSKYQIGLETQMRGRDFIFDCVNLMYYERQQWIQKKMMIDVFTMQ